MKTKSYHCLIALVAALLSLAVPLASHGQVRYPGTFGVVDVIPNNQSGETGGNAEPSIAVGSGPNSGQMVIHAFGGNPIFTSSDFGFHWTLLQYTYDGDATLDWNSGGTSWGPTAYIAMLLNGVGPVSVWKSGGVAGGALGGPNVPFAPLNTVGVSEDQPWLKVVNVTGSDHLYVGTSGGNIYFSWNGGANWLGPVQVDASNSGNLKMRLDTSPDGRTVFVLYGRLNGKDANNNFITDIVVQRDDNGGLNSSFRDLPNNGTVVAHNVAVPFQTELRGQRLFGGYLALAVDPTHPTQVYVAYTEVDNGSPKIYVKRSGDNGQTFSSPVYSTDLSKVDAASLPALAVAGDGTVGLLYAATKGNNFQIHIVKAFGGNWGTPGLVTDQTLASFPINLPIQNGNPWVGDYFQLRAVGNDFYGVFTASGDPQPSHFPSGVYFQRNVNVGGIIKSNFWLSSPGTLADNYGNPVPPSMDPFFYYSVGGSLLKIETNHIVMKTFPTKYPPVMFVEGPVPVPPESFTELTNNPPVLVNGEFSLPYDRTQSKKFFLGRQAVTNATFQIFASADGNGTLSPMGIVMVPGTSNQMFTAMASNNFGIGTWHLDGAVVQTGGSTLTISNVIADHTLVVMFPASNDLAVTVAPVSSDPANPVFAGSNLTYVVDVMNDGLNPLTDVTISNVLDPTVTFLSATASQGSVAYAGGSLTGNLGGLAPGAVATVTIATQPQDCGSITDVVSVACDQFEPNLTNNTAMDVSTIWGGDMGITYPPQSQVVDAGATVSFTVYPEGCPAVFTYQWNFDGTPIIGATNATLTLTNVTSVAAGEYDVWVIQNVGGAEDWQQVDSAPATLTVISGPAAPYVVTGAAGPVNFSDTALNGTVLPNGLDTTYWFQWGLTANYGQSTFPQLAAGSNSLPVNAQEGGITGLAYGTTYHFQLYGSNAVGVASGGDQTFTTRIPPPPAIVATLAPNNITSTSALLEGTVNGEGSYWLGFFEWGTTTSYGNTTPNFYYPGTSGPGATYPESTAIAGLAPNTTYHYRIEGDNGNPAEALGNDVTFSTSGSVAQAPPTIQTLTPVIISSDEATLTGTYNPNGADTAAYFEYGLTMTYGNNTVPTDLGAGNTTAFVETPTYGLLPNTTYHCQLVAYNSGGTSLGGDVTFTTSAASQAPPTVQTLVASSVTSSSATLNGSVNPNGANTTIFFEWGTTTTYGTITVQTGPYTTPQSDFQATLSGLAPNTTYHFRVDANNVGGISYGADATFTTGAGQTPPAVQTLAASSITASSAVLNGLVNPSGADTHCYYQYGTTTAYGSTISLGDLGAGSSSISLPTSINLNSPNTLYHYRIVAYNSGGTNYGADVTFTSLPNPPSVTTEPASNNGGNGTLTFNASVNPNGGQTYAAFQYGKTTSFELGITPGQSLGSGSTAQPVTATVPINNTSATYYYQAIASNPGGQTFGATFTIYGGGPQ